MSVADRVAEKIARSHRYLKPLLERGRSAEVLFQSGTPRIDSRTLSIAGPGGASTDFIDFATTSYLGLDSDPAVIQACVQALRTTGLHRYISRAFFSVGEYRTLEARLARITGLPRAIVFPTVTSLHQTLLPLLASRGHGAGRHRGTLVVADEQVHHSMHEALRACDDVDIRWTPHHDLEAIRSALADKPESQDALILADGVYSLAGKIAPIRQLYKIATDTDSLLYLDDSHGFGVFGQRGEGVPYLLGADRKNLIYVGSLSKAIGCYGGFVGTTETLGAAIRDFAGGLLFSGPLPTTLVAGALAAADILLSPRFAALQGRLWENQRQVIGALRAAGLEPLSTESPILCVNFDSVERLETAMKTLHEHCILASVVAFPAVPRGHYRIRLSVSANHSGEDIHRLADALLEARSRDQGSGIRGRGAGRALFPVPCPQAPASTAPSP